MLYPNPGPARLPAADAALAAEALAAFAFAALAGVAPDAAGIAAAFAAASERDIACLSVVLPLLSPRCPPL